MRAYSAHSFRPQKRTKPWRFLVYLMIGFIGGFVVATILNARKPVELVISTSRPNLTVENDNLGGTEQESWSESKNISVRAPQVNAMVTSPLIVEGLQRNFDQKVVVRLKDAKIIELAKVEVVGTAQDFGIYSLYRAELTFEKPKTKTGMLEVFQNSLKDKSEIDKITVPVRFE